MPRHKAPYAEEFRHQIVELVQAGRNPKELAREFDCHVSSMHNWVSQSSRKESAGPVGTLSSAEREELIALRRKLRQVEMERDILATLERVFSGIH